MGETKRAPAGRIDAWLAYGEFVVGQRVYHDWDKWGVVLPSKDVWQRSGRIRVMWIGSGVVVVCFPRMLHAADEPVIPSHISMATVRR
jgi:hypothetical protein